MNKIKIPVLHMVLIGLFLVLTALAFVSSNMFDESYCEFAAFGRDNLLLHGIVLVVLLAGCYLGQKVVMNKQAQQLTDLLCLLWEIVFPIVFTFVWAKKCAYVPVWDPEYVCSGASAMAGGLPLSQKVQDYLGKYPHQMGFVWFLLPAVFLREFPVQ